MKHYRYHLAGMAAAAAIAGLGVADAVWAGTITDGFTYAVASDGIDNRFGDHFHSSTGGDYGNPAGKAEVGNFYSEEVRGLSEYNLDSLSVATSAFVTFEVYLLGGLFVGENDFLYEGNIAVASYLGNNSEDITDYEAASTGSIGSFSTIGLAVGDTLSFDITSVYNAAILNGDESLGIKLFYTPTQSNGGAITFDWFRLTTDNQSNIVPLPAGLPMLVSALAALGVLAGRRRRI
ncbi:hypothetical protein RGUI_3880 [Rhodovulum sp. P5]|uniref:VPLPA-CTERM sorting domain-containing protein n=1 Tax=Rhodovulum sp. P5 TaxID=1564506 RepID=UPI0009C2C9BE|nr:VPLPA-CTERM sorting domain-containing protein [Rhodovulum sp. P5]ARE42021.1 hypothetical protein RGUI_3880 [Rhodovulum sp. P5]